MKTLLATLVSILVIMTAGIAFASPSTDGYYSADWEYDPHLNYICLDVSASTAKKIGFPNEPTDHVCVTRETSEMLTPSLQSQESGSARIKLANLELVSDVNGRVYLADIIDVK